MAKHRQVEKIAAVILVLAGLAVAAYPALSQQVYTYQTKQQIGRFEARMKSMPTDERENLYHQIQQYNRTLFEEKQARLADPFSYQQVGFSLIRFGFAEEMIGYIEIPAIHITLPIYLGASPQNLKKGAALLTETSLPVGGDNTNAVIAAHRGYAQAAMLRDIEKIAIGDTLAITNFRETLQYRVTEIKIIEPHNREAILIQPGRDLVTLLACHPYGENKQRYLVYGERVGTSPQK